MKRARPSHPLQHARGPLERYAIYAVSLIVLLACAVLARAQESSDALLEQLALEVAVVAAHEGAFTNLDDTDLIWQVVEHRASTTRARLAFLRSHSGRALGRKSARSINSVWSVELLNAPDAPPASLSAAWWRTARAEQWSLIRRRARGLVHGLRSERPCPVNPHSWGYAGDLDAALEDGLVPAGSVGTLNECFVFAPKVLRAAIAKGGRR